eukprot:5478_1
MKPMHLLLVPSINIHKSHTIINPLFCKYLVRTDYLRTHGLLMRKFKKITTFLYQQQSIIIPLVIPLQTPRHPKKQSKTKSSKWKIRRKGYNIRRRDSFNDKLPLLTRPYNADGDEQQLVIFRDVAYDINSTLSVAPIIREYEPDIIVFEYGRLPFFDKYIERNFSFSNMMMPVKKLFAAVTPFRVLQTGVGKMFYGISKKLYKSEISSYGFESALDFVYKLANKRNKKEIPIVAADLHHKITDTLRVFNDYLDLYNIATLLHYGIIDAKFVKASTRIKLGDTLANVIQMRLYPHMTCMNVYRNDILSCVINEIDGEKYKKVLLISQAMRLNDLFDKLCGKSEINKWIKSMDDEHILMNKLNAYQYKIGSTKKNNTYLHHAIQSEYDEEILKCRDYLGLEQTAFLLMQYPLNEIFNDNKQEVLVNIKSDDLQEKEFVNQLKQEIAQTADQLKMQYP